MCYSKFEQIQNAVIDTLNVRMGYSKGLAGELNIIFNPLQNGTRFTELQLNNYSNLAATHFYCNNWPTYLRDGGRRDVSIPVLAIDIQIQ